MDLIISSYRFRLVQLCREFIKQGYLTQSQYDQLVEFYKVYHGLGGNGQAQEYYEKHYGTREEFIRVFGRNYLDQKGKKYE